MQCRLERTELLEIPEDTAAAGVRKPVSVKLALVCFKPACFDFTSIFIYNSTALEVESKHLSFCFAGGRGLMLGRGHIGVF